MECERSKINTDPTTILNAATVLLTQCTLLPRTPQDGAAAQAAAVQAAYGNDTVCLLFACFLSEHGRLSCPHRLAMSAVVFYARDARGGDGSIEPHVLHTS